MAVQRILVVIPTLNEERHIEQVLRDLHRGLPMDLATDFVVCDGGSSDRTVEIVERLRSQMPSVRVLHNPRRLQSAAVNLAVSEFGDEAEVLVRCDAHAGYPSGYIAQLVSTLMRTGADSVVVPMDCVGDRGLQRVVGWVSDSLIGSGGSAHRGGRESGFIDHGHHAAFRMSSFRRAGGYDETYSHNEDSELDCRQRAYGSRIFLDASIRITYHPRETLTRLWRQYFAYGQGRSRTIRRHPDSWRLRQLAVPVHVGLLGASGILAAVTPLAWVWPLLYAILLTLGTVQLLLRHGHPQALLAAPVAATLHTAWGLGFLTGLLTVREAPWREKSQPASRMPARVPKVPA